MPTAPAPPQDDPVDAQAPVPVELAARAGGAFVAFAAAAALVVLLLIGS